MKDKLDIAMLKFLESVFGQYPTCRKLSFTVYNCDDGSVSVCEESIVINDIFWANMPDEKMSDIEDHIRVAIKKLHKIPELEEIKKKLINLADILYEKSCADPLNNIWRNFWQPENLEPFTKSIRNIFKKRFPPRCVDYVSVEVHRNGTIIYYPDGEEE